MKHVVEVQIGAQVEWRAVPGSRQGVWVGICDALNLSVEAESLDDLHSLIPESMDLLMADLVADNEFDRYLKDRGWRAVGTPDANSVDDTEFRVPWHLMVPDGRNGSERRNH